MEFGEGEGEEQNNNERKLIRRPLPTETDKWNSLPEVPRRSGNYAYLSSQSGRLWLLPTLSVSVCVYLSVCVSVCPAFTAYISVTMGWILIKLGGNVGT